MPSFSLILKKKEWIVIGIGIAAAVLMEIWSGYPLLWLIGFAAAIVAIEAVHVNTVSKGPLPWLATALLYIAGPYLTTFCIQYIILEPELYRKTSRNVWKLNTMCVAVAYCAVLLVVGTVRFAWIFCHIFFLVFAFADYFVYEFRQNEINVSDLNTIRTGLSVAKGYRFVLHERGAWVLLISILVLLIVWKFRYRLHSLPVQHIALRVIALAAALILVRYLDAHAMQKATQTWEKKGSYKNGFVLNFILGIQDSIVKPPEIYSDGLMKELETKYGNAADSAGDDTAQIQPTIITVMNESFADFRLVGDLQTNVPVMPFLDSLKENTLRGFALSSVFGAKTPNSEWEYLTGNSMAFLPVGSVVYQQYFGKKPTSLVSDLKNLGYTAVAMHPYYSTGWSRNTVYPEMGFDEMRFMDTGDFDETKILRNYITDEELFDKIIQRYEAKEKDEPLFIMSITMQNHGGYKESYENFENDVHYLGGNYADADQYLSLCRQTDLAMEKLIGYFSQVKEPVEIVFFGDHLPSLNASFFRSLNGKGVSGLTLSQLQNLFSVPFFIWTNYDTPEETLERTSLNYLGTLALERAGIPLPPYRKFQADMMEAIPAMNVRGYYSPTAGRFLHIEDAEGTEREWLLKYESLQYNALFDKKKVSKVFFPYLKGE